MKKLQLLALLLAIVCLFAACSGGNDGADASEPTDSVQEDTKPTEAEKTEPTETDPVAPVQSDSAIVGSWVAECDLTELMSEGMGEDVAINAKFVLVMNLDMGEDGTMVMTIDKEATAESAKAYIKELIDVLLETTYAQAEAEGMSREEFDAQMEASLGMSYEEYMETNLTTDVLLQSIDDIEETATYRYEDGKLYIDGSDSKYWEVTVDGDQMTVTAIHEDGADEEMAAYLLPMEFTRK